MQRTNPIHQEVNVTADTVSLTGELNIPENARGIVLFAHGSGSGRHSPRNRFVAQALNEAGLGTLLIDLLTRREEEQDRYSAHLRFDIKLLADRVVHSTDWLAAQPRTRALRIGIFGASTGAAAALVAAAQRPRQVAAVVSRGGRPDLADAALGDVQCPTLLIVGSNDHPVIEMNEQAMRKMRSETRLEIIPGATHLFEEPGTLEQVAHLAGQWFVRHL